MQVSGIINMLEAIKITESKLQELNMIKECKRRIIHITLETVAGAQVKLELSEKFSENLLKFVVEEATKDYEKNIEELEKIGVKVTNIFEKQKIENEINVLKEELDDLWGRGLFSEGQEVQKYIKKLENKLKEL